MKSKMFAIFDKKALAFMMPFCMQNNMLAIRAFSDLATTSDHPINKHPEDYSLYYVGEFDDANGQVGVVDPVSIFTGLDALRVHAQSKGE